MEQFWVSSNVILANVQSCWKLEHSPSALIATLHSKRLRNRDFLFATHYRLLLLHDLSIPETFDEDVYAIYILLFKLYAALILLSTEFLTLKLDTTKLHN